MLRGIFTKRNFVITAKSYMGICAVYSMIMAYGVVVGPDKNLLRENPEDVGCALTIVLMFGIILTPCTMFSTFPIYVLDAIKDIRK